MTAKLPGEPVFAGEPGAAALPHRERGPRLSSVLYLLADSRPLFPAGGALPPFADAVRRRAPSPRAAYVGASNGDEPAFYDLFAAAMEAAGIDAHRAVPSAPSAGDLAFLEYADLVLLAGGDVARGWRVMAGNGVAEAVVRCAEAGAVLVGVSAGAVQLGLLGWPEGAPEAAFPTFGLAPFAVGAHQEADGWAELGAVVARSGAVHGIGIPFGGAVAVHPDGAAEALGRPAVVLEMRGGTLVRSELLPAR